MSNSNSKWNDDSDVLVDLRELPPSYLETRNGISMKGVRGAPDWFGYEKAIWDLSEKVRIFLRDHKKIRGSTPILDEVARLVNNKEYGKGRQNFVLLLGDYGKGEYTGLLGGLLDDNEVYGHAIKALVKSKAPGFGKKIEVIFEQEKTAWIKSSAKKYLEKYG